MSDLTRAYTTILHKYIFWLLHDVGGVSVETVYSLRWFPFTENVKLRFKVTSLPFCRSPFGRKSIYMYIGVNCNENNAKFLFFIAFRMCSFLKKDAAILDSHLGSCLPTNNNCLFAWKIPICRKMVTSFNFRICKRNNAWGKWLTWKPTSWRSKRELKTSNVTSGSGHVIPNG